MRRTTWSLLVVGLCAAGWIVAGPTLARVRASPYQGQFLGPVPGTVSIWPVTINGKGNVSSDVTQQIQPQLTLTWGAFSGHVDADGLMRCTGVEFIRTADGGFESAAIDFKANVSRNVLGSIVGETGTGDALTWQPLRVTTSKK